MGVYCFDGIREGGDRILGLKVWGGTAGTVLQFQQSLEQEKPSPHVPRGL